MAVRRLINVYDAHTRELVYKEVPLSDLPELLGCCYSAVYNAVKTVGATLKKRWILEESGKVMGRKTNPDYVPDGDFVEKFTKEWNLIRRGVRLLETKQGVIKLDADGIKRVHKRK